jgi:hypothetical protein
MRIDRARAAETIEAIAKIELNDNGAEAELVQLITTRLEQCGWQVENREVLGSASAAGVRRWLAYLTVGLGGALALLLARGGFSIFWSFLTCGLAIAGWLWLVKNTPRGRWRQPPLRTAKLMISRKPSSSQDLPRVVIRVTLGTSGRFQPMRRDGAGIALLLELAQGWAVSHTMRVDMVLLFVRGHSLDHAGDRALAELLTTEWPRMPTFLITLVSPGISKALLIHENGRFVTEAAKSLWVPCRIPTARESWRLPLLSVPAAESEVWIGGFGDNESHAVDFDALARAAQLVEEVVLRWGKRHMGAIGQPPADRNASRSFQKPG